MIEIIRRYVIPVAFELLPIEMRSKEATAMLLAIGLQESRFLDRDQADPLRREGPAFGFWQFEAGSRSATANVLTHPLTSKHANQILLELRYQPRDLGLVGIARALAHNDILAASFARLQLWTYPGKLPTRDQAGEGWQQYLKTWHPGKPHPDSWPNLYLEAWDRVEFGRTRILNA